MTLRVLGSHRSCNPPTKPAQVTRSPMPADPDHTPCPACRLQGWLCVCAHAPRIATRTSLLILVHRREWGRSSNTARLLSLAVRDTALVCHGRGREPTDLAPHLAAGVTPVVLFPGRGARP